MPAIRDDVEVASAEPGPTTLRVCGRATVAHAGELHQAALASFAATGDVTIDCDAVTHLDSAAGQVLLSLAREVTRAGRRVLVRNATGQVRGVVRLMGIDPTL